MRIARIAAAALFAATSLSAQPQGAPAQNAAATNPQTTLPYGAKSADPVSKWTPPASAGSSASLAAAE